MVSRSHMMTFLLFTTFLFVSRSISAAHHSPPLNTRTNDLKFIRTRCNATLYPDVCFASLSRFASRVKESPALLAEIATSVSLSNARSTVAFLSNLSNSTAEVKDCVSSLKDSTDSITDSFKQLRDIDRAGGGNSSRLPVEKFNEMIANVQTWMSAALTYEEDCTDSFEEDDLTGEINTTVCDRVQGLKRFTSNALALVNTYSGNMPPS